ncbi:hypothetical protein ACWG8W_08195 [Citricoccus zhacaiensis]
MMKRRIGTVLGLGALLMVTGCSQGGTGIALLDEPATGQLEAPAWEGIDPQSVRFVADHEGVSYYLATPADPELDGGLCLVAGEPGAIACGGPSPDGPPPGSPVLTLDFGTGEAAVFRDGADTSELTDEGWTQVHENLLVRDSHRVS